MSDIKLRIAAKTDVGLERSNNEDNLQVAANLDDGLMRWVNNEVCQLGRRGTLLVVADGMGGMNAGEVASEIAINAVRELFTPEKITDEVVKSRFTIEKYMNSAIVTADKRIKEFAKDNPESRGMGTTIVIGWLFDGMLYVSWCGDSRAYIYNANTGLFQISKDHSYVQDLVDQGKISKEDAFDFPDSNIITRSLSDATPKAKPDSLLMPQPLCNGDIILLCSDGLSGMIRDVEIEQVIRHNEDNMTACVDQLIKAALDAGGADNCTVVLCQILSGGMVSSATRITSPNRSIIVGGDNGGQQDRDDKKGRLTAIWVVFALLLFIFGGTLALYLTDNLPFFHKKTVETEKVVSDEKQDTAKVVEEGPETSTPEASSESPEEPSQTFPAPDNEKQEKKREDGVRPNRDSDDTATDNKDKIRKNAKQRPTSNDDPSPSSGSGEEAQSEGSGENANGDDNESKELTPAQPPSRPVSTGSSVINGSTTPNVKQKQQSK